MPPRSRRPVDYWGGGVPMSWPTLCPRTNKPFTTPSGQPPQVLFAADITLKGISSPGKVVFAMALANPARVGRDRCHLPYSTAFQRSLFYMQPSLPYWSPRGMDISASPNGRRVTLFYYSGVFWYRDGFRRWRARFEYRGLLLVFAPVELGVAIKASGWSRPTVTPPLNIGC